MIDHLFAKAMKGGAKFLFAISLVLLIVAVVDTAMALETMRRLADMEQQQMGVGPLPSWINLLAKLILNFAWPVFFVGLAIVVDRLDRLIADKKLP